LKTGVDIGYGHIGVSVSTETEEVLALQMELRKDIKEKLRERRGYRRGRRSRGPSRPKKTSFSKPANWLAPSTRYVVTLHRNLLKHIMKFLPLSEVTVEMCKFDFQLMMNPATNGKDYQNGPQRDFDNTRQFVLCRDKYECQACHGKSRDKVLEVHHIVYRSNGGTDIPSNLITLCSKCHKKLHQNKIELSVTKTDMPQFRAASTVNIASKEIVRQFHGLGLDTHTTFGYITSFERKRLNLAQSHVNDAYVIAGNHKAKRLDEYYKGMSFKRHYRKLHEAQPRKNKFYWHKRKNGTLKRIDKKGKQKDKKYGLLPDGSFNPPFRRIVGNAALICGFAIRDIVIYNGKTCFISGRHSSGSFELKDNNTGKKIQGTVNAKKLKLVCHSKPLMITDLCKRE
jgi:hypothetical protein